ncbi:hypothetical protein HPB49_025254 [Dermacentor silvarum]|uniref:Uncharacterized protein n=1 Tax=Dermacentor silvarum TaxID=543639 RepID=A0ACB8DGT9_DERSI|nr:hypothetical protein HPB49_025254 [Dermacentor silvarum]
MLSNAEETLTTDDKPATIGALSDRDAASVPITEQTNDSPPGEDMDEDTPPLAIDTDTIEDEAYNGACWKVVRNKRRARNAAAHETASLRQNASEHPSAEPKQSGPKRLPPLPLRDEKVILRPLGDLRLDKWPRPTLATALWTAAGVSPNDRRDLILRTRPEQNLAIVSTPSSHVADALLNIQELSISQRTYPVSAYLAAPDDSCKEPGRKKAIEDEQRQLKASTNADPPTATIPASGTSFKKAGRSRSKTPSRSRPKARVNSKYRSRSRFQSSSARNQVKRQTTPASQASPQPYKKALLNKLATSAATPDRQQAQAPENTNAKAAPREVSCPRDPPELALPQPSPHNTSPSTPLPNTHSDSFPEIARLRRDMEARHAHMHAQLEAAIERTNARIQAAIESARQESLALRQEIISVIHASEERTHALFAELVSRLDSISAPLPASKSARLQPPLTGARRSHPYSRPAASSLEDDGDP